MYWSDRKLLFYFYLLAVSFVGFRSSVIFSSKCFDYCNQFSTSLFFFSETSSNILPQEGDVSDRVAGYLSPFYHYQPPLPQFGNMAAGGWPPNYPHRPMMPFGVGYPSGKFFTLETLSNNTLVKICIKLIEFLVLNVSVD